MNLTNLADIRALLARHDFRFSKSLGQNFLTAAWVPADIADASGADARTGVLEVGPGIGCLTEQLAQRAGKVVSVELDERRRAVAGGPATLEEAIVQGLAAGEPKSGLARRLAREFGVPKSEVYDAILEAEA